MKFFNLPASTRVQKVVPKNAFDLFTNTKQKKLIADKISRITWTHKLSEETINLEAKDIKEIQIFKIELKVKDEIQSILEIIDKSIPYSIIFIVEYEESTYLSLAVKHSHVTNENLSVIDWTFKSDWMNTSEINYQLNLKKSLDEVFKDLCVQISGKPQLLSSPLSAIIKNQQEIKAVKNEIEKLKSKISKKGQFNERLEFNLMLKAKEKKLVQLLKK